MPKLGPQVWSPQKHPLEESEIIATISPEASFTAFDCGLRGRVVRSMDQPLIALERGEVSMSRGCTRGVARVSLCNSYRDNLGRSCGLFRF